MSPSVGKSTSDEFDEVLEHVGSEGRFQHRFNYLYNMFFTFLFAMPCFNIYLAFTIPGHWCHVPGRNETNYTLEEWKQLTLPKLGRRPVFLMAAICLSLGRTITAFSSSFYYVFLAACFLGNTASSAVFLSPLLIGVEMTTAKLRTHITMLQFIGWGSGFSAVPAIAWLSGGNWKTLLLASSLPSVTMFFAYKVLCHLIYYSLIIMVTNMSGNPFLNFFLQAIIEFPGFLMGRVLCDKMGRRWGQGMAYSIAGLCCLIMSFVVNMPNLQWFQTILVVTAKCFTTLTVYGAYLLNTEVYPTCVRQSGSSAGFVASGTLGVLAPYIAYMGTALDFRYPYILLSLLAVLGVLSALFLPETKDEHLPDTLAEAAVFGRDQSFWSFPGGSKRSKIFTIGEGAEKSRANSVAK
ncbi:hypothetical protein C0J52_18633 [Blattella germanica]|nr:hypothetical protein C0J52_18633 [Blattella germanica]